MSRRSHQVRHSAARLRPIAVKEFRIFKDGYTYAVCPRCRVSMDREYVCYCSNCGQRLSWQRYRHGT